MKTIFIGVGAYNEPYIQMMIDNCLENAKFPERIHFGLWLHNNSQETFDYGSYENIKCAVLHYDTLLGVPPARLNSLGLYAEEDYYLQVDGHMLFEKHWDTTLIDKFELIRKDFDKPIITTYTPWWSMTEGAINYYSNVSNAFCAPMVLDMESSTKDGYPKPKTKHSDWVDGEVYKEHHFISAHFLFTDPSFIQDVLPDPLIMYSGEEITTAVRAWTRGYRMFCIKNPIAWHLNKFHGDRYSKDRLWDSKNTGPLYDHFMKKNEKGARRSKDILTGKITGYWGAETVDLLKDYEEASGLDFKSLYEEIGK